MTLRSLTTICSLAGVIALWSTSPAVAGQGPAVTPKPTTTADGSKAPAKNGAAVKTQPKSWSPPHTSWGDPDLQGIWNDATSTPLQRPDKYAGKDVLNDEEAA